MSDPNPKSSAFWSLGAPAAKGKRPRKVRADAVLLRLCAAAQEQVIAWCDQPSERDPATEKPVPRSGGFPFAKDQLASVADQFSIAALRVSERALSHFYSAWHLNQDMDFAEDVEELVLAKTGDAKKARQAAEAMLLQQGLAQNNPKLIHVAALIADSGRSLDLQEETGRTKAAQTAQKIAQKDRDFALAREKFVTDACEKIMKAARDPKMREIAEDTKLSNSDKIAAIRKIYFADIDSVEVQLPA